MGEGEGPSFYTTLSETPRQQVRKEWGTGRVDPAPAGRAEGRGSGRGWVALAASVCSARCGVGSRRPSKYVAFYFISFCLIILIYLFVSANILNTEQNSSAGPIQASGL